MMRAALDAISLWAMPVLLVAIPLVGIIRKVKVYDVFIEGAKEGFDVAIRIIPFLVGILVAIGMFRGSGAMDLLTGALRPIVAPIGFPPELVPLGILRSLTGSGSLAFTTDLIKSHGPDSSSRARRRRCTDRRRRRSTCWPCISARSACGGRGTPCPRRSSPTSSRRSPRRPSARGCSEARVPC